MTTEPDRRSDAPARVLALAVFAGMTAWFVLAGPDVATIDHCPDVACDFTRHYWTQARASWGGGIGVALGWYYPPAFAFLLGALLPLGLPLARLVWAMLSLGASIALVIAAGRLLATRWPWPVAYVASGALVVGSLPVWHAFKWGQPTLIIAALSVFALTTERPRWSGLLLGLCGAIKIYPLMFIVGRPRPEFSRVAVVAGATVAASILLPLIVWGPTHTWALCRSVLAIKTEVRHATGSQALQSTLFRWIVDATHVGRPRSGGGLVVGGAQLAAVREATTWALTLSIATGMILWSVRRWSGLKTPARGAILLVGVPLLLVPTAWHHVFVAVPWVLAVAAVGAGRSRSAWLFIALSAVLAFAPLVAIGLSSRTYFLCSQWGVTTWSALAAWIGLLAGTRENAQHGRHERSDRRAASPSLAFDHDPPEPSMSCPHRADPRGRNCCGVLRR